jgi:anti-anti-sigma factor
MTITLVGVLTPDSVPLLADLVDEAATKSVEQLVFDLRRLRGLSSAGVRCMLDGHQRLGRGVRFVIRGARPEVAELIRQAGFRHGVTMLDR